MFTSVVDSWLNVTNNSSSVLLNRYGCQWRIQRKVFMPIFSGIYCNNRKCVLRPLRSSLKCVYSVRREEKLSVRSLCQLFIVYKPWHIAVRMEVLILISMFRTWNLYGEILLVLFNYFFDISSQYSQAITFRGFHSGHFSMIWRKIMIHFMGHFSGWKPYFSHMHAF